MKIKSSKIIGLLGFAWSIFMGVTFVSLGLGALYPPLNKISQPFVCSRGRMDFEEASSNPMPGTTVTQIGWYCVDRASDTKTKISEAPIHLYAGGIYGTLMFATAVTLGYFYIRKVVWVRKMVHIMGVLGIVAAVLIPVMPLIGLLFPKSKPGPHAVVKPPDLIFQRLTSKTTSDFHSSVKPLAQWNGIPILPEATVGEQSDTSTYVFKAPVTSGSIESYYREKLKDLGWSVVDHRWQGVKFAKESNVLLVTFVPADDMQSFVVTLVRTPSP